MTSSSPIAARTTSLNARRDFVDAAAAKSQSAPFVDPQTGKPLAAFDDGDLRAEVAELAADYRLLLAFPLPDGSYTRIWIKAELVDESPKRGGSSQLSEEPLAKMRVQ